VVSDKCDGIIGLKSISAYLGVDNITLKKYISNENFPAVKILGTWFSEKSLINEWIRGKVRAGQGQGENMDKYN
jgi:hypothetical protein